MNRIFLFAVLGIILSACSWQQREPSTMMDHSMMDHGQMNVSRSYFSTETKGLPEATSSEIIELADGEEYVLSAREVSKHINGQKVRMFAYNGSIPGPTLKVQEGSTIRLRFENETDVATSIHSHGIRLKNDFDGSHLVQNAVAPGDSFEYEITFPDPGMYWYHPHFREDYLQELGLYGNYWVVPSDSDYWSPVNREVPLFLDDILLNEEGIVPFAEDSTDHALMGRFGNVMLVNGETNYRLQVQAGEVVRFFITNSANTRPFHVTIPGVKLKLAGGDSGVYEHEAFVEQILISPSERIIVDASFPDAGSYELINDTPNGKTMLGTIEVSSKKTEISFVASFEELRMNEALTEALKPYKALVSQEADKFLKIDLDGMSMGHMMGDESEKIEWEDSMPMMNEMATSDTHTWQLIDAETDKKNLEIDDWKFKRGDNVKMRIFNDPDGGHPMQHPIHIHGQRFLVLSINGIPQDNLVWKDTVLIQTGDTVDLVVEMSNPGAWMIHCHIAEHLESRMMMKFEVL